MNENDKSLFISCSLTMRRNQSHLVFKPPLNIFPQGTLFGKDYTNSKQSLTEFGDFSTKRSEASAVFLSVISVCTYINIKDIHV